MDRTGQIFEGRYRLQRRLGQGGMATVYAALDQRLDKAVAVKVLADECAAHPRAAQRFVQEARAASRIRHAHVLDVTDFGVAGDGVAFLVMELLRGEDLAATLAREGPLPWPRVGPIALQICAALAAAHRVGVIHRDIKPSNCFRLHAPGNPDFIKVLDFGIARVLDPQRRVAEPTTAGTVLGTPEYIAPEVAAGEEAGPRSDLYAVGALLYKLLTGVPPFVADSYQAVLAKQIFEPPIPPRRRAEGREIPEPVDALILRALAKAPADRFPDMAALAAAIADTLPGRPAVELWIDPNPLEPTDSLVVAAPPPAREPATRPLDPPARGGHTLPLDATPAARAARTLPLATPAPSATRPHRWPLAVVAGAAALAAAFLVGRALSPPAPPSMAEQAGPLVHAPGSMPPEPGAASTPHGTASSPASASSNATAPGAPASSGTTGAVTPPSARSTTPPRSDTPGSPAPPLLGTLDHGAPSPSGTPGSVTPPASSGAPISRSREPLGPAAAARASSDVDPSAAAPPPPRRSRPRFDLEAARRELRRHAAAIQTCALDSDMLRGELLLAVTVDDLGRIAAVDAAPGSRRIDPAALACIRRQLTAVRLAPAPGVLVETFSI